MTFNRTVAGDLVTLFIRWSVQTRARLCGLAWPRANTSSGGEEQLGRASEAGPDFVDGLRYVMSRLLGP